MSGSDHPACGADELGCPLQVITSLDDLDAKIAECNDALTHGSDDAMRRVFQGFRLDLSASFPPDPFSAEYRAFQMALHARIVGRPYGLANERTLFDTAAYEHRPFPYYTQSCNTAGHHLLAMGFMLRALDLPPGARVVEFGPGWGNTSVAMAMLGLQVTAVDIEPNFCEVLRTRARQSHVDLQVVESDFFWAETVSEPFDAAVFFECFHHCDDHMRLLRALHKAVKPGGKVLFASEPIANGPAVPWGVRMDGEALWAMRNFGWLELGFDEAYFSAALARTGWAARRHACADPPWASVWEAWAAEPDPLASHRPAPAVAPAEALRAAAAPDRPTVGADDACGALRRELDAVYASTSWRLTAPLRWARRLGSGG